MLNERNVVNLAVAAGADANAAATGEKVLRTKYLLEAFDKDGKLKWTDYFWNAVVTEGLNDSLDKHFKAAAYTAAWYVALTDSAPSFAPGDTMSSHPGWSEITAYTEGTRPTLSLGAITSGSVDNSASRAVFSVNANGTAIGGAFVCADNTKGGSTGVLYGGGAFSAGDKSLDNGDTLNVTVVLTAASA